MTSDNQQPSEELLNAIKELKGLDWRDQNIDTELWKKMYLQRLEIAHKLATNQGLPFNFVNQKVHEIETCCKECSKQITTDDRCIPPLCSSCLDKKERQEWLEYCERSKKENHLLERYCYDIRGMTFPILLILFRIICFSLLSALAVTLASPS